MKPIITIHLDEYERLKKTIENHEKGLVKVVDSWGDMFWLEDAELKLFNEGKELLESNEELKNKVTKLERELNAYKTLEKKKWYQFWK